MGGISIMFPIPYYLLVFTFAAGGGNPILLGIFAGIGLAVGDSTSYLFGYHGGKLIPKLYQKMSRKITKKIMSSPEWARNLILFTWGAVTPFPNDILIVPLGLMRYPYKKTIIPIGLGNIVFNTAVAFAGAYGFHLMGLI
jgi:membrane protein YqaA with SNARE-associated domain